MSEKQKVQTYYDYQRNIKTIINANFNKLANTFKRPFTRGKK